MTSINCIALEARTRKEATFQCYNVSNASGDEIPAKFKERQLNKSHAIQQYDLEICKFQPKIDRVRHFDLAQDGLRA